MKIFVDFLPILLFFIVFKIYDIYAATAVAIVASLVLLAGQYLVKRQVEPMAVASALIITIFGGMTIWLKDPTFIKLKPSILYLFFALALWVMQLRGTLLIEKLMGAQLETTLPQAFWRRINYYWIGFFVFCTLLNLYVAYNFSLDTWVSFKLFGFLGLTLVFVLFQAMLILRAAEKQTADAEAK